MGDLLNILWTYVFNYGKESKDWNKIKNLFDTYTLTVEWLPEIKTQYEQIKNDALLQHFKIPYENTANLENLMKIAYSIGKLSINSDIINETYYKEHNLESYTFYITYCNLKTLNNQLYKDIHMSIIDKIEQLNINNKYIHKLQNLYKYV